jgi:hypothetical protein
MRYSRFPTRRRRNRHSIDRFEATSMHRFLFRLTRFALAWILCAIPALSQSTIVFDPARDLPDFEACSLSEYHDLYPIDEYSIRKGDEVTPDELEGLRANWKAAVDRATKQIALLATDPGEAWLYALKKQLAKHSGFSRITYSVERPTPDIALLVEKPYRENTEHGPKVSELLAPWIVKLDSIFRARVVTPQQLSRRDGFPLETLAILSSEASYRQYLSVDTDRSPVRRPARYDPRLKMVVGYLTSLPEGAAAAEWRAPILVEFVRELQHAYYDGPGDRPGSLWLNRGFASYLAGAEALTPDALDKPTMPLDALERVVDAYRNKADRDVLLHPVEDLVQARDERDVMLLSGNRSQFLAAAPAPPDQVMACFDAQAVLWMHFLQHGQGGRFKEAFDKFLASAMQGQADLVAFRLAFLLIDFPTLNRDFYKYLFKEHERLLPTKKKPDASTLETLFADRDARNSPFGAVAPPPPAPIPTEMPSITPADVAIDPSDFEPRHGLALVQARKGELEAALEGLRELAKQKPPAPEDVRIARDIDRIEQTIRLRDGFFENLRQTGKPWVTGYQHQELTTPIAGIEGEFLLLGSNSLGVSKIPLKTIAPFDIARQAGLKEEQGGTEPWVRFYPYVLAGESKWEKLLKDDSPKSNELREDAREWYPELIQTGEVAIELNALSRFEIPKSAKQATPMLRSIKKLKTRYEGVPLLQRNIDKLRQLVTAAAMATHVETEPAKLLKGQVTSMGDGTIHLVYDFVAAQEGDDFVKDVGYLAEMRTKLGPAMKAEADSTWKSDAGDFSGVGSACYRHSLRFAAPMTVACDIRYSPSPAKTKSGPTIMFGMCDDRHGNYLASINFGGLAVIDLPSKLSKLDQDEGSPVKYSRVYALELRHDGTTVSTWLDGNKVHESSVGARQSGELFWWFNTDYPIAVQRIEIHGKIDRSVTEMLRAQYIAKVLSEAGFN